MNNLCRFQFAFFVDFSALAVSPWSFLTRIFFFFAWEQKFFLICFEKQMLWGRHVKSFASRRKLARQTNSPTGCEWRHRSLHLCATLPCPRSGQTHVVWIQTYTDRSLHSLCFSFSLKNSNIPFTHLSMPDSAPVIWQFTFWIHSSFSHHLHPLPASFACCFCCSSSSSSHACTSDVCTSHPVWSEIFELFSSGGTFIVPLEDVNLLFCDLFFKQNPYYFILVL